MSDNDKIVVGLASAAEVAGRSVGSLRKLVAKGVLTPLKDSDGQYVFRRADLEALPPIAARDDATEPGAEPPSVPVAASAGDAAPALLVADATAKPMMSGERAAEFFAAFNAGTSPVEVVISMKASPEVVAGAYQAWRALRDLYVTSATPVVVRLEAQMRLLWDEVHRLDHGLGLVRRPE